MGKQGDNALGSICLSIYGHSHGSIVWLTTFVYWHGGRPWPCLTWDCRSRLYVKGRCQTVTDYVFTMVNISGSIQRSRSNVCCVTFNMRGKDWPGKCSQMIWITLTFGAKDDHYQSKDIVCVFVMRGLMQIILGTWSIDFLFLADVLWYFPYAICIIVVNVMDNKNICLKHTSRGNNS